MQDPSVSSIPLSADGLFKMRIVADSKGFGISLLVERLLNLWVASTTVRIVKDQKPDVITVEYEEKRF